MKYRIVFGIAANPTLGDERVGDACVKRVVSHCNLGVLDLWIAKSVRPVNELVDLDAPARQHFGCSFWRSGSRPHKEIFIVRDETVWSTASARESFNKSIARTFSQSRVINLIVNLIGILAQPIVQVTEWPRRFAFWIDRLCYLPDIARDLRITAKVMNELCVSSAEKAFANGPKSHLAGGPCFLDAFVTSQKRIEVGGSEFRASIHDDDLR